MTTLAIIGAGRMGQRHIGVARKLDLQICGIVDLRSNALFDAQAVYGLASNLLFVNHDALYEVIVPDVLIISTTADSHCELTCAAAERGVKYILVEKPLAVSLEECERMMSVCRRYGAKLSVNHQMRFMEQYSKPKALLDSDAYGGLKSMTVVGGNFGISMNGTHYFEAFRYMTNEAPVSVTAWFDPDAVANPRGPQFQDRAGSIRVTTESGKRLYIEIGCEQGHGLEVIYAARNGMITISELTGSMRLAVRQSEYLDLPTTRYGMPAESSHETIAPVEVIDSTAMVLNALLKGENVVTAEEGMIAVKVLVAAYTSAENGSIPVLLDERLDCARIFPWA